MKFIASVKMANVLLALGPASTDAHVNTMRIDVKDAIWKPDAQ